MRMFSLVLPKNRNNIANSTKKNVIFDNIPIISLILLRKILIKQCLFIEKNQDINCNVLYFWQLYK